MEIEVEGANLLLAQSTEALPCFPGHVIYCLLVAELTVQQAPLKCLRTVLFPKNPQYYPESQEETLWEGKYYYLGMLDMNSLELVQDGPTHTRNRSGVIAVIPAKQSISKEEIS